MPIHTGSPGTARPTGDLAPEKEKSKIKTRGMGMQIAEMRPGMVLCEKKGLAGGRGVE
jgi:hypothetical protein